MRMTQQELLNKLELIRLKEDKPIDEFYPELGISKSSFHLWKRGAAPKGVEVLIKIWNKLNSY